MSIGNGGPIYNLVVNNQKDYFLKYNTYFHNSRHGPGFPSILTHIAFMMPDVIIDNTLTLQIYGWNTTGYIELKCYKKRFKNIYYVDMSNKTLVGMTGKFHFPQYPKLSFLHAWWIGRIYVSNFEQTHLRFDVPRLMALPSLPRKLGDPTIDKTVTDIEWKKTPTLLLQKEYNILSIPQDLSREILFDMVGPIFHLGFVNKKELTDCDPSYKWKIKSKL